MAEVLSRIGKACARHGWRVIAVWLVILAGAGVACGMGAGTLANSFDIPGTPSSDLANQLATKLPDLSGASGMVVIHTDDGSAFTQDQQDQYAAIIAQAQGQLPDSSTVVDPFATQAEIASQAAQITSAETQITEGKAQITSGQTQVDAAAAQIAEAQTQLDAAYTQAQAAGSPASVLASLDAQRQQLNEQEAQVEAQKTQLTASLDQINEQATKLDTGAQLLALAKDMRFVSDDGSVAIITVSFSQSSMQFTDDEKQAVIAFFAEHTVPGVDVDYSTEIAQQIPGLFGTGEAVGLALAAVVLLVMFGSVIAAVLPLVTAATGVGIGILSAMSLSGHINMASLTPILGLMLGLAVGIDYSLFIVNRHRRQLATGMNVEDSIGLADGTAGTAVFFAGCTVIVALLALNITRIPFLGVMGTVGAVCVLVAVLIALTLTPAILGLLKQRILGKRARARLARAASIQSSAKPMSTKRALFTAIACVAALLIIAVPALSMRLGLPNGSSEPPDSTAYNAYTITNEAFGDGANSSLLVTVQLPFGLTDDQTTSAELEVAQKISNVGDVAAVAPITVSSDGFAAFQVKPDEGPDAQSTADLVRALRAETLLNGTSLQGASLGVTGEAAVNIDISQRLSDALPLYLGIVVVLSLIIMVFVFRSLLVPIIATGGFVLSLFATYGATVAVFQWGWLGSVFGVTTPAPLLCFLPILMVGCLFGLAMDYQLFLATGMREAYANGAPARTAVTKGLHAGRTVVTAAALIMVSVFGSFVFSDSSMVRPVGFGLAIGIVFDAFVVRLLLMPALMHLVGRGAWWLPRWLDRILPNVDVEGAALQGHNGDPNPPASTGFDKDSGPQAGREPEHVLIA